MSKQIEDLKLLKKKQITPDYFVLELYSEKGLPKILPGQFAEVLVNNSQSAFLRRPLSIHDVDYKKNTLKFLVQVVGNGTRTLCEMKVGEYLNTIYPLGNQFNPVDSGNVLLIGGGCGVAPLLYLARDFKGKGLKPTILIGTRSKKDILELDEYKRYGNVFITTEDGSHGEKGFITQHSIFKDIIKEFKKIYTCGPDPMMKAVAKIAKEKNIECEVSLENTMACGIGACLCCVTETIHGNLCTCTDGPIFNINELKW